jgi:hypothetical protein
VDALQVLRPLLIGPDGKPSADVPETLDRFVTALVISAGTEGVNSILKLLKYAKEDKKTDAALKTEPARGGVPVPPVPTDTALRVVVHHHRLFLRQGESDDLVARDVRAREAAARANYGHELPLIRAHVSDGRRLDR